MENTDVVKALDAKIAQLESQAEELKLATQRLATVSANLDALRKTRALMAPENGAGARNGSLFAPTSKEVQTGGPVISRMVPGSIAATAFEVLREAGQPLHVKELLARVQAKRKGHLAEGTLVSVLCGYVREEKLKRTAPSTYGLL